MFLPIIINETEKDEIGERNKEAEEGKWEVFLAD
jgi:hypothetical protein